LETLTYLPAPRVENVNDAALKWASIVGVEVCLVVAVEPMDGERDPYFANVQKTVPTCARQDPNNTDAKAKFRDDNPRKSGDSRDYKRYVQVITMPNSLYVPELSKYKK